MFPFFNSAASQGKKDGLLDYPTEAHLITYHPHDDVEIDLPSYEIERLALAERKIVDITLEWEKIKQALESKLIIIDRDLKIHYNEFKVARDDFFNNGMKRTKKLINGYVYLLVMFILGLFEFPLNYEVASSQIGATFNIFGVEVNEAVFVALGMISVLLISAHVVGSKLKQWHQKWEIKRYLVGLIALGAIFAVLHSMYYLRMTNEVEIQEGGLDSAAFTIDETEDAAPLSQEERTKIEDKIANLMLLNAGFLIVGISLSYFSHDEDQELEFEEHERNKLYKKLKALSRQREKVASSYDTQRHITQQKIQSVQFQTIALIAEYRDWNQKYRPDKSSIYPKTDLGIELFSKVDLGAEKDIHNDDMNAYMQILDDISLTYIKTKETQNEPQSA
jgi:hypothetical protein